MRLEIYDPHVTCGAQAWQAALAVQRKRRTAYIKQVAYEPPAKQEPPAELEPQAEPEPPPAPPPPPPRPHWRAVVNEIALQSNTPFEAILGRGRTLPVAALRQFAIAMVRKFSQLSLLKIGSRFSIDHSTAVHAICRMRPIISKLELEFGPNEPPWMWIEAALPLVEAHVARTRQSYRNRKWKQDHPGL